jgi:hypothetical protein
LPDDDEPRAIGLLRDIMDMRREKSERIDMGGVDAV